MSLTLFARRAAAVAAVVAAGCASMHAAQPGNDLACEDDGATCHYCPVYNESVSVSRCTEGRWVNTRATCEE